MSKENLSTGLNQATATSKIKSTAGLNQATDTLKIKSTAGLNQATDMSKIKSTAGLNSAKNTSNENLKTELNHTTDISNTNSSAELSSTTDILKENSTELNHATGTQKENSSQYFISYRQGGIRYEDILSKDANPLKLEFEENIFISADKIWDQLATISQFNYINFKSIYGNNNPVNLEIGIGNGEFLAHIGSSNPDENFLGLEVFKEVFLKAVSKVRKQELNNCRVVQFDTALIVRLIEDNFLNSIYVNFPDPWPKKAHKKRRLLKTHFIDQLASKLKIGGTLYIATDHDDYAEEIAENIVEAKSLKSEYDSVYVRNVTDYFHTKYYRKFVSTDGAYFFKYKRI